MIEYLGLVIDHRAVSEGTDSNETLIGTQSPDILNGQKGDDDLLGGQGNDTFIYCRGDGNDTITEIDVGGSLDRLLLVGVDPEDVTLTFSGIDVTLVIAESAPGAGDGGSILLKQQLDEYIQRGVEQIVFADATVWSADDLRAKVIALQQTSGNDTIVGFDNADTIEGGAGDDVINGGRQNDTYLYSRGDGNDTITEIDVGGSLDRLLLVGVDPEDVTLTFSGIDVTLVIAESAPGAGDGGSILLKQQLDEYIQRGVEQIVFADATVWSADDLRAKVIALQQTSGNDTIVGFDNADTIEGGAGDDVINGGRQNDTYLYSRGDGNDTITEIDVGGSLDRLLLVGVDPEDVTLTFSGIDVTLVIAESAPGAGDGGSILLKQQLDEYIQRGVEQIVFADATVWSADDLRAKVIALQQTSGNDTIVGFDNADTIEGGAGDDVINGGRQNDTYLYSRGDGNDTITEIDVGGSLDRLLLVGVDPEDVTLTFSGIDVTLVIAESAPGAGDGGSILLKQQLDEYIQRGVEQIVFADATVWSADDLRAKVIALQQTSGNDTIVGFDNADTIEGGAGDDVINGGRQNDTYLYSRGDGNDTITEIDVGGALDKVVFADIDPEDVTLTFSGIDVTLVIAESAPGAGDGGSILLKQQLDEYIQRGVEQIVFADATVWSADDLRAKVIALQQTSGNDTIVGFDNADTIEGGAGDDVINGGRQNDTYLYSRGDGNDTITEIDVGGSLDRLLLVGVDPEDVTLTFSGIDVTLVIAESAPGAGDGGSILLKQQLDEYIQRGVEQIVFADATVWSADDLRAKVIALQQTSGNDTIVGFDNADTIEGGAGDDVINGGRQNDTYLYSRGDGNDTITEIDVGGALDKVVFADIDPEDISVVTIGNDVMIVVRETLPGAGDGGSILLKDQVAAYIQRGVEEIHFSDATVWNRTTLLARAVATGTASADVIAGTAFNDYIDGGAGDDTLSGGDGDDVLIGGAGADAMNGGAGSDTASYATASTGVYVHMMDDTWNTGDAVGDTFASIENLIGSDHDDTLIATDEANIVSGGAGADTLLGLLGDDLLLGSAGNDLLHGGEGADFLDGGEGNDELFGDEGNDELHGRAGDDYVVAGDGNDLLYGEDGDDELHGSDGDDQIHGGDGADALFGDDGDDKLDGGAGDDFILTGAGDDTIVFRPGYGSDFIGDFTAGANTDDVIEIGGFNIADFAELQGLMSEWGGNTFITFSDGSELAIEGVTNAQLHSDDFRFAA
ncbi:calcium-binding protein [Hyphomicrobium sp. 1Nfss2.1]|uniref:calcium-binding protein n=1 Tax=Hyphomicrobium sp. 1Nfss2.1 TaxID=3413936 RepID=UPI003C7E80F4